MSIFLNKFYSFNFECFSAEDYSTCQKSKVIGSNLFLCMWYRYKTICTSFYLLTDDFQQVK